MEKKSFHCIKFMHVERFLYKILFNYNILKET